MRRNGIFTENAVMYESTYCHIDTVYGSVTGFTFWLCVLGKGTHNLDVVKKNWWGLTKLQVAHKHYHFYSSKGEENNYYIPLKQSLFS